MNRELWKEFGQKNIYNFAYDNTYLLNTDDCQPTEKKLHA